MFQYAASFRDPTTVTATNTASGFAPQNAANRIAPFRAWRAASYGGDLTLTFDFGASAVGVWGFGVWHCNAPQIKMQLSADGSTWAGLPGAGLNDLYTLARDFQVYKYFVPFASQQNIKKAQIIIPAGQTLNADVPYLQGVTMPEVGTLFFPSSLTTVARNPTQALEYEQDSGEDEVKSGDGSDQVLRRRYPRVLMTLSIDNLSTAERAAWENVLALGKSTSVLWYFNEGYPEAMYWTKYSGRVRVRDSYLYRSLTASWRSLT